MEYLKYMLANRTGLTASCYLKKLEVAKSLPMFPADSNNGKLPIVTSYLKICVLEVGRTKVAIKKC